MSLNTAIVGWFIWSACALGSEPAGAIAPPTPAIDLAGLLPASGRDRPPVANIRAAFLKHDFAEVKQLSDSLVQRDPQSWEAYFWKGMAAIQQRDFRAAVRSLRTVEKLDLPDHASNNAIAKNLAIAYYLLDQRLLFESKMKEAIALDPADFAPYYYLGRSYLADPRYTAEAAAEAFRQSLGRKPGDAASICFLGIALEGAGDFADASRRFREALDLTAGKGNIAGLAYQGLARLSMLDDARAALELAKKAVAVDPQSVEAQLQLAKCAAAAGDGTQQLAALQQAEKLGAQESRPQYQMLQLYRHLGDENTARAIAADYKRRASCFGYETAAAK